MFILIKWKTKIDVQSKVNNQVSDLDRNVFTKPVAAGKMICGVFAFLNMVRSGKCEFLKGISIVLRGTWLLCSTAGWKSFMADF